ncbi:MAG: tetratricopeptide repeat protein, partial [Myxococcales bacterium]|nr:tetratricopeptide repeat protein [Myxococcales bacterium]
ALYEAVYGERPFEGSSMAALMVSMRAGVVRPAPKGSDVPASLRKVLLRGLSVVPTERWPSMEALLEELRRLVAPRRRRWMVVGVTMGLVAVGGGLGATRTLEWLSRCTGARKQLEGVWDDARRQEVRAAILGTELSYAPGTLERLEPRLDEYADAWATEHTEACEATWERGEQSEEEMSLRMGCLRERSQQLRATVNELADADATVVEHAVRSVASLPRLERCRDLEALRTEVQPPEDPVVADQVAALEELLVEAKAKMAAGKYAEGLRVVNEVVEQGAGLHYEPLMARAWLLQGQLRDGTGDYEGAAMALRDAYGAAVARRMSAEAAEASMGLVSVLGVALMRQDEGRDWLAHAEPMSRAAGTDEARAAYFNGLGVLAWKQAEYDEARAALLSALTLKERVYGPDHPAIARALANMGVLASSQGKYAEARDFNERALASLEKALGPDHPDVAQVLVNLANVVAEEDTARELGVRALAIREKAFGPEHPLVAASLNNNGTAAYKQGKLDEARDFYERALAINEKVLGSEHPSLTVTLGNLGSVAQDQGKLDEARGFHQRALTINEKALGPEHPDVARSLARLGSVAQQQGKLDEARDLELRALAISEKALGPEHPDLALALGSLGSLAQVQGNLDEALALYQRALAIQEKALGPHHYEVAPTLVDLGSVAHSQGKLGEARDLHERALVMLEQTLGPEHPNTALPLTGLGMVLLDLGQPAQALPSLERALALRTTHQVEPGQLAATHFALARALWSAPATAGRDRPRARMLAEQARDAWVAAGVRGKKDLAEVEQWLAEHG